MLDHVQAGLVGLVGEVSDLDEEILESELEDMDASDGSTTRLVTRKRSKSAGHARGKVKIFTDSSTKNLKLAQGL